MAVTSAVIGYGSARTRPRAVRKLTLEETEGGVRVLLPVMPLWFYPTLVAGLILGGLTPIVINTVTAWNLVRVLRRLGATATVTPRSVLLGTIDQDGLFILYCLAGAAYSWFYYRRTGRFSRTITASAEGLTWQEWVFWRLREQRRAASEISAVEFRPLVGNLTPWRDGGHLIIRLVDKRSPVRFRLLSRDQKLPRRIAERLAAVLGKPLEGPIR
jgi:hypothetical protein